VIYNKLNTIQHIQCTQHVIQMEVRLPIEIVMFNRWHCRSITYVPIEFCAAV